MKNFEVFVVIHSMGIDGSSIVAIFSKEEDAEKLADLYNKSDEFGEYNHYYVVKETVDEYSIDKFAVVDINELYPDDVDEGCTDDEEPYKVLIYDGKQI